MSNAVKVETERGRDKNRCGTDTSHWLSCSPGRVHGKGATSGMWHKKCYALGHKIPKLADTNSCRLYDLYMPDATLKN